MLTIEQLKDTIVFATFKTMQAEIEAANARAAAEDMMLREKQLHEQIRRESEPSIPTGETRELS